LERCDWCDGESVELSVFFSADAIDKLEGGEFAVVGSRNEGNRIEVMSEEEQKIRD